MADVDLASVIIGAGIPLLLVHGSAVDHRILLPLERTLQGKHDGFLIADLPDGVAASALAAAVGASGAVTGLETHQLFDHEEQAAIVQQAGAALRAYKPPTA